VREVEEILRGECSNQIASNQHFFLNLPFPLCHARYASFSLRILFLSHVMRESNTPTFAYDSQRVTALSKLVLAVFRLCQCSAKEIASMLPRANVIVREYRVGQQISFHVDELECDSEVCFCKLNFVICQKCLSILFGFFVLFISFFV
jgi:hypothetical protein